jgi:hypothetical protein
MTLYLLLKSLGGPKLASGFSPMGTVKTMPFQPNSGKYLTSPGMRGEAWNRFAMIRTFLISVLPPIPCVLDHSR